MVNTYFIEVKMSLAKFFFAEYKSTEEFYAQGHRGVELSNFIELLYPQLLPSIGNIHENEKGILLFSLITPVGYYCINKSYEAIEIFTD